MRGRRSMSEGERDARERRRLRQRGSSVVRHQRAVRLLLLLLRSRCVLRCLLLLWLLRIALVLLRHERRIGSLLMLLRLWLPWLRLLLLLLSRRRVELSRLRVRRLPLLLRVLLVLHLLRNELRVGLRVRGLILLRLHRSLDLLLRLLLLLLLGGSSRDGCRRKLRWRHIGTLLWLLLLRRRHDPGSLRLRLLRG